MLILHVEIVIVMFDIGDHIKLKETIHYLPNELIVYNKGPKYYGLKYKDLSINKVFYIKHEDINLFEYVKEFQFKKEMNEIINGQD